MYIYIYICIYAGLSLRWGWWVDSPVPPPPHMTQLVVGLFPWALFGPFPWAFVGPFPTDRSEAFSERSDEVRDYKIHIKMTEDCT